jgi:hypothetical protein
MTISVISENVRKGVAQGMISTSPPPLALKV